MGTEGQNRRDLLHEMTGEGRFRAKVEAVLAGMRSMGYTPRVAEALRTPERQQQLVLSGRSRTLRSLHLPGPDGLARACDIVDSRTGWGASREFWLTLGRLALAHGLDWGGLWMPDRSGLSRFLQDRTQPWNPRAYSGPIGWDPAHVQTRTPRR